MDLRKPCTRCLLAEIDPDGVYKSIRELTAALPDDVKAPPDIYEKRLSACRECSALRDGMCSICGCFVEYRAANIKQVCPSVPAKWK